MLKLLCIGKSGQVAQALAERAAKHGAQLQALGRPDIDLTAQEHLRSAIEAARPDLVINAAAFTQVDHVESERDAAFAVNAEGPKRLAEICAALDLPMIHISTDYVFDGTGTTAFQETDTPAPLNVYGVSKLSGEDHVRAALKQHIILRTSWVYSPFGANFVKTMLRLAKERGEVSVVDDQVGCPTSAFDIADAILQISNAVLEPGGAVPFGTYHFTADGEASWADVAAEIFETFEARSGCKIRLNRIPSSDYPTPAARPLNSRLDTRKITDTLGITPRPWREGVRDTVDRLMDEES